MLPYIITSPTFFHSGKLTLSKDQARLRAHNLKHIAGDIYEIVNPVQFKAGEKIGYDGGGVKNIYSTMVLLVPDEPAEQQQPAVETEQPVDEAAEDEPAEQQQGRKGRKRGA